MIILIKFYLYGAATAPVSYDLNSGRSAAKASKMKTHDGQADSLFILINLR